MVYKKEKPNVRTDVLKSLYYEEKDLLFDGEADALNRDRTERFEAYLKDKIISKELINITVNGEVATGKSTVGITIQDGVNRLLERIHKKKIDNFKHITSDQTEFVRFIRGDKEHACVVIDEWSAVGQGGANATTEMQLYDTFADIFAQKYIHRINCSPSGVNDLNCHVILTVLGADREKKVTRCKLTYREPTEGSATLGYVDIYVGDTIEKGFYKRYRTKKFKRMDLLQKEGVRDVRELEFAKISLMGLNELADIAGLKTIPLELIAKTVDMKARECGLIYSLIAKDEIANRCRSMLVLIKSISDYQKLRNKTKTNIAREDVTDAIKKVTTMYNKVIDEEIKLVKLHERYINIQ